MLVLSVFLYFIVSDCIADAGIRGNLPCYFNSISITEVSSLYFYVIIDQVFSNTSICWNLDVILSE